ncbi:MAG: DUF3450 domain-containing protein [Alphaproteobacteria bacterium]|nr:DUF3450 domain-containing protein [Alphaproteobacteria bacterium]
MTDHVFRSRRVLPAALLLVAAGFAGPAAAQLDQNKGEIAGKTADGAKVQTEIDTLDDQRGDMEVNYRRQLAQLEALQIYNDQQRKLIAKQEEEVISLQSQIEGISTLTRDLVPLMLSMTQSLEQFIELDLPFLLDRRRERVETIKNLIDNPAASPADRYRAILSAYEDENDYGRTIQAYEGELDAGGEELTVNFLRVGRIAFYYQTQDQQTTAIFNPDSRAWEELPDRYNAPVRLGIKMAQEIVPPDVLVLPVHVDQEAAR